MATWTTLRRLAGSRKVTAAAATGGWTSLFDGKSMDAWRGYKMTTMPEGWSIAIATHLALCPHCRRYRSQMELIGEAARLRRAHRADPARVAALQTRIVRRLLSRGGSRGED